MPSRLTDERAKVIAQAYCNNGFDKTKGLKAIKNSDGSQFYSDSYCQTLGHRIYNNIKIKAEIDKIIAQSQRDTGVTIALQQVEHQRLAKLAEDKGDLPTATRNIELLGKTIGAYTENIHTTTERQKELTEAEEEEARRLANIRLRTG